MRCDKTPRVTTIKVGRKDDQESYEDALGDIEDEDDEWYGLAIASRDDSDIVEVANWAESRMKLFVAQSGDEKWLESSPDDFPFDTISEHSRTAVVYHDTDAEALDLAWLANRLAFDPDTESTPWDGHQIRAVETYSVTTGERSNAISHGANLMLPFGPAERVMDPGVNIDGRPLYEMVTKDWFRFRLEDRIAQAKINASNRGEKIPINQEGISILRPIVEGLILQGVEAGHFVADQWEVNFYDPTPEDITDRKIRADGVVQIAASAREFDLSFNFQQDPVFEEND